jgi:hypothetical protein
MLSARRGAEIIFEKVKPKPLIHFSKNAALAPLLRLHNGSNFKNLALFETKNRRLIFPDPGLAMLQV